MEKSLQSSQSSQSLQHKSRIKQLLPVCQVFILHYKPNVERKENLIQFFRNANIDYLKQCTWITDYDREELTDDYICSWYNNRSHQIGFLPDPAIGYFVMKELSRSEISLCIKYMTTFFKIVQDFLEDKSNNPVFLFIEDDALFDPQFVENFSSVMQNLPLDLDVGYVVDACGLHLNPQNEMDPTQKWIKHIHKRSRTTGAFIMTLKCIRSIVNRGKKFQMPADFEFMILHQELNHQVYWLEPPLIYQGSESYYSSNLRDSE